MSEIIVLSKNELSEVIRQITVAIVLDLRSEIEKKRTPELMTKSELAEYLRCKITKIDRLMKEGLPFEKFGAHPRFRKSTIDEWLKRQ